MQLATPLPLVHPDDAPHRRSDIFSRMSDVELLAELRRIRSQATRREDAFTADRAGSLFASFYEHRTQTRVPEWLWEATRVFVRQHAPSS
jgi:hypothetical protein